MAKVRISTTVDEALLVEARLLCAPAKDASLMEKALRAFIAEHRAAAFDNRIDVAYRDVPLDRPDEWGDLESFLDTATQERDAAQPR